MSSRIFEIGVLLATIGSAILLGLMLGAPLFDSEPEAARATASPSATASATVSATEELPPIGLYQATAPIGSGGVCLGLELEPRAYPVALGARGEATVLWWEPATSFPADPAACESRVGPLHEEDAIVERTFGALGPAGSTVGYRVAFHLPAPDGGEIDMDLGLLTARSSADRIQVVDLTTSGTGLVFEWVDEIDPPLASPES